MMRVALIVYKALPIYGIQLANGLSELAEVHLFITDDAIKNFGSYIDGRVDIHPVKTCRYRDPRGFLEAAKIIKDITNCGCDIAHLTLHEPTFNLLIPFIKPFPLITTVHDVNPHVGDARTGKLQKMIADLSIHHSDGLIVHGEILRDQLCSKYDVTQKDLSVIPHMNYSFYGNWASDAQEEENNILFFGSIWKYKGLKYLMQAEPILSKKLPNFTITIAGKGEDFGKYRQYISDEKKYRIVNTRIPDESVAEYFQKASVVVLPYIEASQTGIVPIAFSFGKPVVCTNVGSIPEIVDDGVNGLIVHPRNPEALANAIAKVLQDQGLKRYLSENAKKKAFSDLSWGRIASMHIGAYNSTIRQFRGAHNA